MGKINVKQRIIIISPNLEQGLCGVSDYCIVLRNLFLNLGNETYNLALADKYISDILCEDDLMRIPFNCSNTIRVAEAISFIEKINPDKIYLNFISYGFNTKGFPFFLIQFLGRITEKYKSTIIVHELWPGIFFQETFRNKLIGFFQQYFISYLFRSILSADFVVNTEVAKNLLGRKKIPARLVPVFSNIPIERTYSQKNDNLYRLVIFGTSGFKIDYLAFYKMLIKLHQKAQKNIEINIIGEKNVFLFKQFFERLSLLNDVISIRTYTYLNIKELSALFHECDLGISYYMPQFWGKSGSIAAMLAHGLAVITVSEDFFEREHRPFYLYHNRIYKAVNFDKSFTFDDLEKRNVNYSYNNDIFHLLVKT